MKVIISNMSKKPEDCTVCPICNGDDDCMLQSAIYDTWDDQYKRCPLEEKYQLNPFDTVVQLLRDFDLESEWDGDLQELAQYICDLFKDGPYDSGGMR